MNNGPSLVVEAAHSKGVAVTRETGGSVERVDVTIHSFIIKIVIESNPDERAMSWHGQITHVGSGESRGMKDLADISSFIGPYLPGHAPGILPRLKRLLK